MNEAAIAIVTHVEMTPLLFGAKDAAKLLGISERTLYRLTNAGNFDVVRIENRTLWCGEGLRQWVDERKQRGASGRLRGSQRDSEQAETIGRQNGRVE